MRESKGVHPPELIGSSNENGGPKTAAWEPLKTNFCLRLCIAPANKTKAQ